MVQSTNAANWVDKAGNFQRPESYFRNWISSLPSSVFTPEKDRYHLYAAYSCPWAHRVLILRHLKGLEDLISVTALHWLQDDNGWKFATDGERDDSINMTPDPLHSDFTHLRDIYLSEKEDYTGRFTTPTLYDKKTKRIVSNESADILRMLNKGFDHLLPPNRQKLDLYPEGLRCDIDLTNEWIQKDINEGVYSAGFALSQESYAAATLWLFSALDRVEAHLADRAQAGKVFYCDTLTEVDVRLYTTLIRFDPVYVQHFKVNIRAERLGYPTIHKWLRILYWTVPAFKDTTNFEHIKKNYTRSHTHINPHDITPLGPIPHILPLDL